MDKNTAKSLNAAICCLEYMQFDLANLGMDRAVDHIGRAIQSISETLPASEPGGVTTIIHLDNHRR